MYTQPDEDIKPLATRNYDIVVFGATGFTGNIICKYLTKTYGLNKTVKWAIAGRSVKKLEELRAKLAVIEPSMDKLECIMADSKSGNDLKNMCGMTKVVISTVGPYATHGTLLVNVCAGTGTNYVDITGETDWVTYCQS